MESYVEIPLGPQEPTAAKFWMVWCPTKTPPRFKHYDREAAVKEAHRLAKANPGEKFVVLESVGEAEVPEPPVVWRDAKADSAVDLPF